MKDMHNKQIDELISDPAIQGIFESFEMSSPVGSDKEDQKAYIKEKARQLKLRKLTEAEGDDDDFDDEEFDFDEDEGEEFTAEDFEDEDFDFDEDEGDTEVGDVSSAIEQARMALEDIASFVEDEAKEEVLGDEDDDFDDMDIEDDVDLEDTEMEESLKAKRNRIAEKIRRKIRVHRIKEKIARRQKVLKLREGIAKADRTLQAIKEKVAKVEKNTPSYEKLSKMYLKVKESRSVIRKQLIKEELYSTGGPAPGPQVEFPKAPKKTQTGTQKQKNTKTEFPKAAKKTQKGNIMPTHGTAAKKGGEAVAKPGKFPGKDISRMKEARRQEIRERIKAKVRVRRIREKIREARSKK